MFAESITDAKGQTRTRYPVRLIRTPCEKLTRVPEVTAFLRTGSTLETLRATAPALSDHEAAEHRTLAQQQLFMSIHTPSITAA